MKKLFELVGVIRVDGLQKAQKHVSDFEKQVKKIVAPIDRFGKQLAGIGTNLTRSLTLPIALAGGAVLKFGGDFEKAMTNSLAIMGDVSDGMKSQMEDVAMELSERLPYSSEKAAEAYFFLASAGKTVEQSMALLPKVAEFAAAGNFDLALATDLLTDAQSALGLTSKDVIKDQENMVKLSDVLVKANTLANASVQQFSESLTNKAGAALRILNKDVEEGVAVLAAYADQGEKADAAGEKLNIVLRDLQRSALANEEGFKRAGIQVYDSSGKMNNLGSIIGMLENRLMGMSDKQKRAELTMLGFQDRSISAMLTLIGTSDSIKRYEEELRKAGGTTQEVSDKQMQSFNNQMLVVRNRIGNVAIEFSRSLLPVVKQQVIPALEGLVERVKGIAQWFNDLPEGVKNTVLGFTAFIAVAGPALLVLGKLISSIKIITTVVTGAKLAMVAFNGVLAVSPIGLITLSIVAMGVAIHQLTKKMETAKTLHGEIVGIMTEEQEKRKSLTDGIDALKNKVKEAMETIQDEATLTKMFAEDISNLTKEAKELGFAIEGSVGEKFESLIVIQNELNGIIDSSTGKVTKYTAATKEDTESKHENVEMTLQQIAAEQKLQEARDSFVGSYQDRIEKLILTQSEQLDLEEKRAMESADALKLSEEQKAEIQAYYQIRRFDMQVENDLASVEQERAKEAEIERIGKEAYDKRQLQIEKEKQAEKAKWDSIKSFAFSALSAIADIYSMFVNKQISEMELKLAKEKEAIESSKLGEEEKQAKFAELDETYAKKKRELQVKQAKASKSQAIFDATMGATQMAINGFNTKPFLPLGLIMGGVATALGLAKVAMIAAQPLPQLADGGLIKQSQGGTAVVVGEGGEDEAVLPMRKGAFEIADRIVGRLSDFLFPVNNQPALAMSGGGALGGSVQRSTEHHWHIGTLIANKEGIKQLERTMREFRVSEENRRGE